MIDYAALLGAAAGLRVAKANYDFTRDEHQEGTNFIDTEIIPAGSLIVASFTWTEVALTFDAAGYLDFWLGSVGFATAEVNLNATKLDHPSPTERAPTVADLPITAWIGDANVTAGKVHVWVFYLPT